MIDKKDKFSESLFQASLNGKLDMLKELIKSGVNVNERNNKGETTVYAVITHYSIVNSHVQLIELEILDELIKAGADVNLSNNEGSTPLMRAARIWQIRNCTKINRSWSKFRC